MMYDSPEKSFAYIEPISSFINKIKEVVIEQDEAVSTIAISLYTSVYMGIHPYVNFIVGPSGSGKTLTLKTICKLMHVPYAFENATQFTEAGYVGSSIEDMLIHLLDNSKQFTSDNKFSKEIAENGVLVIDEIAKKTGKDTVGRDISGLSVLQSLLSILNGDIVPVTYKHSDNCEETVLFDTSKLTIFLSDACIGLKEIRNKRLNPNKKSLGFTSCLDDNQIEIKNDNLKYTKEDLISFGFTTEFTGRINEIIEFNDITIKSLEKIVKNSKESQFWKYINAIKSYGIEIKYYPEIFFDIAKVTTNCDITGARELTNVVNELFKEIMRLLFEAQNAFGCIELLPGILKDNSKFVTS